jgi:hypothetical protein
MSCEHMNFRADVKVGRLKESDTSDVIVMFVAEVQVKCAECGQPFEFIGIPMGFAHFEPRCSIDGLTANMPIKPVGAVMAMDLPSYGVRVS